MLRKLISEERKSVFIFDALVVGAIMNPDMIKIPKIINKVIVKVIKVLKANFWDLKTTIVVNNINTIAIRMN